MKKTTALFLALTAVCVCAAGLLESVRIPLLLAAAALAVCALKSALRKDTSC